jgi:hypothetical protein
MKQLCLVSLLRLPGPSLLVNYEHSHTELLSPYGNNYEHSHTELLSPYGNNYELSHTELLSPYGNRDLSSRTCILIVNPFQGCNMMIRFKTKSGFEEWRLVGNDVSE